MIVVAVRDKNITVQFRFAEDFASIVQILKDNKCRFNPDHKDWQLPRSRYEEILDRLMDVDVVEISEETEQQIEALLSPENELKISPDRRLFNVGLLNFPPVEGKAPNENYQKTDIVRAINRNRYAMFLDMGLGKSYYKASIISHLRHYGAAHKVLIITSGIGALNMFHEVKKFIKDVSIDDIITMTRAGKDRDLFKMDKNIAITNYNTFKYVCDYYYQQKMKKKPGKSYRKAVAPIEEWLDGKPGILLLDESHIIGNNSSQITNRVMVHKDLFEYRYLFTGTPADKPEKLYTQLKILDTGVVSDLDYTSWLEKYAELGTKFSKFAINTWKYDKLKALNEMLQKDHVVYRKTEDCLDLPPNRLKRVFVQLNENHANIYKAFIVRTLERVQLNTGRLLTRDVVNTFPFLQLALDNPKLLLKHEDMLTDKLYNMIDSFKLDDNRKCEATDAILDEHPDEQGIIWIHHPETAKLLAERYKKYNPLVVIGEIEAEERTKIVEQFKADKKHKILIAGLQILNSSVTLINCTFQVYFERIYNYTVYSQSLKRIHRIGQTDLTYTYALIFDTTIDCMLDKNLSDKDVVTTKILSKEFLTKDEWRMIFEAEEDTDYDSILNF